MNISWPSKKFLKSYVNNDYYNHLGENWYCSQADPVAILRIEQEFKSPWVVNIINENFQIQDLKIADIGCGGGFFTNYIATKYSSVYGIDASSSSLEIAKSKDTTGNVEYILGDAYNLPYENDSMDVVCAMDFLEHVERPGDVVSECSRILKPGGLFFFHTFNRNIFSWLVIIKFMEWFVPNTPKDLHILRLFIKPKELKEMMALNQLWQKKIVGIRPIFNSAFLNSIFQKKVLPGFSFRVGGASLLGYIGFSKKIKIWT